MENLKIFIFASIVWGCLLPTILCLDCQIETALSGKIEDSTYGQGQYEKCWTIIVKEQSFIDFSLDSFTSNKVITIRNISRQILKNN
ncbi:hypothetical protein TNCV_4175121 [Trichonephila clavipes]|nr:hypothetical protein TNCV_4175121 [Trichonephila clavipes]